MWASAPAQAQGRASDLAPVQGQVAAQAQDQAPVQGQVAVKAQDRVPVLVAVLVAVLVRGLPDLAVLQDNLDTGATTRALIDSSEGHCCWKGHCSTDSRSQRC